MKKRLLSLALVLTIICSLFSVIPVYASSMFSDINGHWAQSTIEELAGKGIINGKGAGMYDPEGKVTRAEFTKLLMCIVGNGFESVDGELIDVPKEAWYNPYVYAAFNRGVFYLNELNNNYFLPDSQADRETVAVWSVRLLGIEGEASTTSFSDNSSIDDKQSVATAYNYGIVTGDAGTNKFRPDDPLTRAEAATIIKRVIAKYQEIYSLRPSKNVIDYNENIQEFEASENVNVLSSVDEQTGKFVFTKINDEIKNLKKGDMFIIKPCDAIPTGVAIKVESITINGDTAEIYQGDIQLEDVINEIDVAQETEVSMSDLVEGSLGEGVTLAYNDAIKNGANYLADNDDRILMADGSILDPLKLSFNINQTLYKDSDGNSIKATGSFTMDNFKVNCDINGKKIKDLNIKVTETHKESYSINITGASKYDALKNGNILGSGRYKKDSFNEGQYTSGTKKNRQELKSKVFQQWKDVGVKGLAKSLDTKAKKEDIKLASFNFPIGATGLYGIIDVKLNVSFNGEVSATISYSETKTNGIQYTPNTGVSKISERKDKTSDFTVAGKAEAKVGASLRAGITYLYILTVDAGIEGGIGASANTEILSASSTWNKGDDGGDVLELSGKLIGIIPSITATVEKNQCRVNEFHSCDLCIDGCLYLYLKIDAKGQFGVGKFSVTLFNPSYDILSSKNAKIATGYVSFNFDSEEPVTSGWGKCPHNYSAPKIYEKSEDKEIKIGDDLTLSVRANEQGIAESASGTGVLTSNKTSALIYQWYKDNIAIEGATNNIYQIPNTTDADIGTYECIVAVKDMPSIYAISDEIKVTKEAEVAEKKKEEKVEAKTVTKTGHVSENKNSSFAFKPSQSGTYHFENTANAIVLININGEYRSNSGDYELVGGHVYNVNVEWGYEDTNYSINITGPITY